MSSIPFPSSLATAPDNLPIRSPEQMIEVFSHMGWSLRCRTPEDLFDDPAIKWVVETREGLNCEFAEFGFENLSSIFDEWKRGAQRSLERHHRLEFLKAHIRETDEAGRRVLKHWCETGKGMPSDLWACAGKYQIPETWETEAIAIRPKRFLILDTKDFHIELRRDLAMFIGDFKGRQPDRAGWPA